MISFLQSSITKSTPRSPIIIEGALVFPETTKGMIEASITRRLLIPRTLENNFILATYTDFIIPTLIGRPQRS